ncbi:origin recognition complex subunit 2 isoform X2 [Scleropages formosus]|uniref:Origin recognition complex subunit 2 n=1 Tax=Scleropages formosus TaxID=113540 RepID=A0A8C9RS33_SCLFO|nr:origin recognition complex subunit 2 isoform X2 [Scleropages formosus]
MSPAKRAAEVSGLYVRFVGDAEVLEHIVERREGAKVPKGSVQKLLALKEDQGPQECEGSVGEQDYLDALGTGATAGEEDGGGGGGGSSGPGGSAVFTFQTAKRSHKMAQMASEMARAPGRTVTFCSPGSPEAAGSPSRGSRGAAGETRTPPKGRKVRFVSSTPHRLRKRLAAPNLRSESDSDLSPSHSEDEEDDDEEEREEKEELREAELTTPSKVAAAALYRTPAKKPKKGLEPSLVEEYFTAHASSKVTTSDRTLQKLQTPKLDQETLARLLDGKPSSYADEINQLNKEHEKFFSKWMLQLQLGFNVLLYGLGSKKPLLERFRTSRLLGVTHLVVNGFFPSITLKSILNSITVEVLEHQGSFRSPVEQMDFIMKSLRQDPSLQVYLVIHNIDGPMLRSEKTQQALGQLASLTNVHVLASIDHINAPLVWDQAKLSLFNWLWYETTTYLPYAEETSYENSLLVQQSGALALSSLTHVLRSLTPNARGIFRLLAEFQLESRDNPSYSGLSFQEFYQRCREAFLVNSDVTLRTQLTEFRDHKLIRTKKGADSVEYLLIPVDPATLTDFLEKEDAQ